MQVGVADSAVEDLDPDVVLSRFPALKTEGFQRRGRALSGISHRFDHIPSPFACSLCSVDAPQTEYVSLTPKVESYTFSWLEEFTIRDWGLCPFCDRGSNIPAH